MLAKHKRRSVWLGLVVLFNIVFIWFLETYTNGGGRGQFLFGLPEAFVFLIVFVFVVVGINTVMAWWYLGKPSFANAFSRSGAA